MANPATFTPDQDAALATLIEDNHDQWVTEGGCQMIGSDLSNVILSAGYRPTRAFEDADELNEHLQSLNYDHGHESAFILVGDHGWLAYCTDPDGEWFFESGNPVDRVEWVGSEHDGQDFYRAVNLEFLAGSIGAHGATILWPLV